MARLLLAICGTPLTRWEDPVPLTFPETFTDEIKIEQLDFFSGPFPGAFTDKIKTERLETLEPWVRQKALIVVLQKI